MAENGSPENKHKKRKKIKVVRKQPVQIEGNIELVEENPDVDEHPDDGMQAVVEAEAERPQQTSARKKRRSKRTSSDGRLQGKMQIPTTCITAILEELSDDMVDEPSRLDIGDSSAIESIQISPSLPPDKVYVERKNGFATTPRIKMFQPLNYAEEGLVDAEHSRSVGSPLELAILIQKCCRPLYTLCHGLLGGMALLHIIVVYGVGDTFSNDMNFVDMYTNYARVYQTLFHILAILCFISIMDRCDVKHMDVNHLVDLFHYNFSTLVIFLVYFITLILAFITTKWDDWFALSPKRITVEQMDTADYVSVWKGLNLSRNIGAIVGWVLVAFCPAEDMLYLHLCNMMKYQTTPVRVVPTKY